MQRVTILAFISVLWISVSPLHSQVIKATTEDGRQVLLKNDGTWTFARDTTEVADTSDSVFTKSAFATDVLKLKDGHFELWYDPSKWILQKTQDPDKTQMEEKNGDVYAIIIAERFEMTFDNLKQMALNNALKAAPDAQIICQQYRKVNGRRLLCMKITGTINSIKFVYYSYYYAGPAGILQLITFTSANLLPQYESDMTDFLNGIVVHE